MTGRDRGLTALHHGHRLNVELLTPLAQPFARRAAEPAVTRQAKASQSANTSGWALNSQNFFPLRVTEPWNRLPREVVESPSLEILKSCLDKVLCSLLWVTLLQQRGWTR